MKSYGQYCGLARSSIRATSTGLPGIATSVLAERLRELEEAGVVMRQLETPAIA